VQHGLKRELAELKQDIKGLKAHHAMLLDPAARSAGWLQHARARCARMSAWRAAADAFLMRRMPLRTRASIRSVGRAVRPGAAASAPAAGADRPRVAAASPGWATIRHHCRRNPYRMSEPKALSAGKPIDQGELMDALAADGLIDEADARRLRYTPRAREGVTRHPVNFVADQQR
jgi:hypothetical protein